MNDHGGFYVGVIILEVVQDIARSGVVRMDAGSLVFRHRILPVVSKIHHQNHCKPVKVESQLLPVRDDQTDHSSLSMPPTLEDDPVLTQHPDLQTRLSPI